MKRVEIIIRNDKTDEVVKAIKKNKVGGLTVLQVQGQGAEDLPLVGQYYTRGMIITVVEDSKVDGVLNSIAKVACTNTKGDGKVFISNIEEVMDICSNECGHKVL